MNIANLKPTKVLRICWLQEARTRRVTGFLLEMLTSLDRDAPGFAEVYVKRRAMPVGTHFFMILIV